PVAAADRVVHVRAARRRIAPVRGADVAVVAVERRRDAGARAVAGVGRARVAVGAGAAGRLEGAGGGAAVPVEDVAVVALFARIEDAVPAGGLLAHGRVEDVALDAARGEARPLDAEEVGGTRAPGERLVDPGTDDHAGRRRRCPGREAEEGPGVGVE